ncbi:MAG: dihydropteroate synthase [Bacteroidia bacterium]
MTLQDTVFCENKIKQIFTPGASPLVMGILNVTPDSFYDGGRYTSVDLWLERAGKMMEEGVDIIDIGAYSTRPGAEHISAEEESARLIEVVESVKKNFPHVLISADTFRAGVAELAVAAGAHLINDISGGTMDKAMFTTIANLNVPYVLMHIQGTPQTMQMQPQYKNVAKEVLAFFTQKKAELNGLGVKKIILDPGFGFGKLMEHNYRLLQTLDDFHALQLPILVGFSRKSMVNKLLNIKAADALNGTTVLNTIAIQKGAGILRVHDVRQAKEVILITDYLKSNLTQRG